LMKPKSEKNIVADRDRHGVGTLENHPNAFAQFNQRNVRVIDILGQELDLAGGADVIPALIHSIKTAEESRFAATRRPNERRDDSVLDVNGDIDKRLKVSVPEAK